MIKESDIQVGFSFMDGTDLTVITKVDSSKLYWRDQECASTIDTKDLLIAINETKVYEHIKYGELNCFPLEGYISTEGLTEANVQKYIDILELLGLKKYSESCTLSESEVFAWGKDGYCYYTYIHASELDSMKQYFHKSLFKTDKPLDIKVGFRFKNTWGEDVTVIGTENGRWSVDWCAPHLIDTENIVRAIENKTYTLLEPLELVLPKEGKLPYNHPGIEEVMKSRLRSEYTVKPVDFKWIEWSEYYWNYTPSTDDCLQFNDIYKLINKEENDIRNNAINEQETIDKDGSIAQETISSPISEDSFNFAKRKITFLGRGI